MLIVGQQLICNRKIFMNLSDNTKEAKSLGDFLNVLVKRDVLHQKNGEKCFEESRKSLGNWSKR